MNIIYEQLKTNKTVNKKGVCYISGLQNLSHLGYKSHKSLMTELSAF